MRSIYEERYTIFWHAPQNRFTCFYCGVPANELDHQPPISRVSDYEALGLEHESYVKVPCCQECNSMLGNVLSIDLIEREMFLKRKMENRYQKMLTSPEWKDNELRTKLRGNLRRYVAAYEKRRKWINARLEYNAGINAVLDALEEGGPFNLSSH